jgi:serine/threonine-protein kinase HipA
LYSDPIKSDARLAPAYDIANTTAYIPEDALALALDLAGNKSFFASRLGILEFARTCEVEKPEERIRALLQTLDVVLKREDDYCRQAPNVAQAIRQSAQSYQRSFGG